MLHSCNRTKVNVQFLVPFTGQIWDEMSQISAKYATQYQVIP
jgi:hypothetical protein